MVENLAGQTGKLQVSPRVIEKASRLFNATIADIINELLQNSRRAGATRVDLWTEQRAYPQSWQLIFEDDGVGIFRNGMALALGASGWDEQTLNQEDPAGMGIFALAYRGAIFESCSCQVNLSPAHFCGKERFVVDKSDRVLGTRISFAVSAEEAHCVRKIIESSARYYSLPVYLAGERVEQNNFLETALFRRVWQGLEIGVVNNYQHNALNFYGLIVKRKLPEVRDCSGRPLGVRVDVLNCTDLKLVLPARKEVVIDKFFAALQQECERMIYVYVASLESHHLPYSNWQQAQKLGIHLPEAEQLLRPYQPVRADGELDRCQKSIPTNGLLLNADLSPAQAQTFWRGFNQTDSDYVLYEPDSSYHNYSWYDRLPQLTEVNLSFEVAGQRFSTVDWVDSLHGNRSDHIWVTAKIVHPNGEEENLQFPNDVLLDESINCYSFDLSETVIIVTKDSQIDVAELTELLEAAFFAPSYDHEADSIYTQREDFQEIATEIATSILFSPVEALNQRLRLAVERHIQWLIPHKWKVEIRIDGTQVSIEQMKQPS